MGIRSVLLVRCYCKCDLTFVLVQVDILELLAQQGEDHWLPWQQKRPLLHIACERGAWNCVKYLVSERSDEINQCYDEYYPIHQVRWLNSGTFFTIDCRLMLCVFQASLHDIKFLELLIQCGAETTVRTSTQLMTVWTSCIPLAMSRDLHINFVSGPSCRPSPRKEIGWGYVTDNQTTDGTWTQRTHQWSWLFR